jgi:nitroimidazol reductase NimA-like FMN-containing flavoprotein (pyridoxamine 5'-phosphate oxidase superfamily)
MSNQEVQHEISEYVQDAPFGVLAYVRADGTPVQRTFGAFAFSGNDVLLITGKSSSKVAEIASRPKVSFFVEKKDQVITGWKSALYLGTATPITNDGDLRQAVEAISARSAYIRDVAGREGLKDFAFYRLRTQSIEWLNHAKGQGHLDTLVVEA